MDTKKATNKLIAQLKRHMKAIEAERDGLRNLLDEAQGLEEICQNAYDDLETVIDSLSELV